MWIQQGIDALRRLWTIAGFYSRKASRDLFFAAYVGGAFTVSGFGGLVASALTDSAKLGLAVATGLLAILGPASALMAASQWRRAVQRQFPGIQLNVYLNMQELAYDEYRQALHAVDAANLQNDQASSVRAHLLAEYLDYRRDLRLAMVRGTPAERLPGFKPRRSLPP